MVNEISILIISINDSDFINKFYVVDYMISILYFLYDKVHQHAGCLSLWKTRKSGLQAEQ